jgi:uncharacterized protein YjbJ (UPF0337 family)
VISVDWEHIEGDWNQIKGKVKEKWGRLTHDDLEIIAGKRDQLIGRLQEKYDYTKEKAEKEVDKWSQDAEWTEVY